MPTERINNRKDILLLMLYSPGAGDSINEPVVGRTRLVKMMFLFKEEALSQFRRGTDINEDNFYEFFAWNFGPFSQQVYDDIMFFTLREFIEVSESEEEEALPESADEWREWLAKSGEETDAYETEEYYEEVFKLTQKGLAFTESLYDALSTAQRKLLKEFKAKLARAPLRAILRYVYQRYPSWTKESKIREQILGRSFS